MNFEKKKWVYANSQNTQAKIYSVVGTLLAALGVVASVASNMPVWQTATIAALTCLIVMFLISTWIPSVYLTFFLISRRRMLRGFNLNDRNNINIEFVEVKKTNDFHTAENNQLRYKTNFAYTLDFNYDIRFLAISFEFKNAEGLLLKFESNTIDIDKKKNSLLMKFDYSNKAHLNESFEKGEQIPYIEGTCFMVFNLKSKQLTKVSFNKDSDIVTFGNIIK